MYLVHCGGRGKMADMTLDDIFKQISLHEIHRVLIHMSLKSVPKGFSWREAWIASDDEN